MRHTLWVPGTLTTMNQDRRKGSWQARASTTRATRTAARYAALAARTPRFERVEVIVEPVILTRKGRIPDVGAHMPSVKAAIDGLVDAGVLADDGPRWVTAIRMEAPVRDVVEGLRLTLTGDLVE